MAPRQRITRPIWLRGGIAPRNSASHERAQEDWIPIAVPSIVNDDTFALAQERLEANKNSRATADHHAQRRARSRELRQVRIRPLSHINAIERPRDPLLPLSRFRAWRRLSGSVCNNRPVRQDLLDEVVWSEVVRLLEDPRLIQNEIDRRLAAAREADPTKRREDALRRDLARIHKSIDRLLTAYQEGLLSLDELRERMPNLRRREQADNAELQAIVDQSADRAAYLRLADTLTTFLTRLRSYLRATLIRGAAFFVFASAYWALLPLIARDRIAGGPQLYGFLLGAIGAGAVGGAFLLPWLKDKIGPDRLVAAGGIGTAATLVLFGLARELILAMTASLIAGVSWIAILATLNVSAQVALPEWVRGRGLAMFVTVFYGTMTLGSALWGQVAGMVGLPAAHFLAAAGVLLAVPLTWRWKLQTGAGVYLAPSLHWPAPITTHEVDHDRGPVLVTIEYHIDLRNRDAFLGALEKLAQERHRDGAHAWGVFEDTAVEGRFLEIFQVKSWLEHLRQHERVTNADRMVQEAVDQFHTGDVPPIVTHYVGAARG